MCLYEKKEIQQDFDLSETNVKKKKINSLQLATRHPPHSEAMQKENEAAQTGLQENKGPQQEVMLHYQPLASYYITLEFPLAVRMQAERRL